MAAKGRATGGAARELVQDVQRSEFLADYNESQVSKVVQEINDIDTALQDSVHLIHGSVEVTDPAVWSGLSVQMASINRNKRCLLAYLMRRLEKLEQMRWELGSVLPPNVRSKLGPSEVEFFASYDKLLAEYMTGVGVELTSGLQPPKEQFVEVVAKVSCGEIATATGTVTIEAFSRHYLPLNDIEHLIRQGVLEVVES